VIVKLNCNTFTVHSLADKVLKQRLNMVAPDVEVDDNSGRIIISSDEDETSGIQNKTLTELNIQNGARLICDDFLQQYQMRLIIHHATDLPQDSEFEVLTDTSSLKAQPEESAGASAEDEDDLAVIEEVEPPSDMASKKRKAENLSQEQDEIATKRTKAQY